ncbi:MAG: adenylate/guanylate cyclase domain-containing protein [Pseudomonadota bacterium]|nr:adenylate/guanylate cyclase domain-containing protein [Pseudomonadota bacterium]
MSIPPLAELEATIGLQWLFSLRGSRQAPSEVVVVSVDQASSNWLGLSNDPRKWPRRYHALLVDRLSAAGAAVVAFDVIFEDPRDPGETRQLARAMKNSGNVILFEYLERSEPEMESGLRQLGIDIDVQKARRPLPELADAAASLAPFPLPKVPARVNQFWTFKTGAGDTPTLPTVAFQRFAFSYWNEWRAVLESAIPGYDFKALVRYGPNGDSPDGARLAGETRRLFERHPWLAEKLGELAGEQPDRTGRILLALTALYGGPDSYYLDFYGPPQSIDTVSFYKVLNDTAGLSVDLKDKAIFVGFSEQLQPEQKDGFYTVFSQKDGLDISGVEIAATAFGNLLENRTIEPLPAWLQALLILMLGLAFAALFMWLPGPIPVLAAGVIAVGWVGVSLELFTERGIWLPVVTPLLFELPVAMVGALLWRYLSARRERQRIREGFGYFVPERVVDELAHNLSDIPGKGEIVYGVCLSTDAEKYTQLAEQMPPDQLREYLNAYYEHLFLPVRRHGGIVCDVVGDAMMAIWVASTPEHNQGTQACRAALEILEGVDRFNDRPGDSRLPTRIGLHGGRFLFGSVGARDHFEYRAVGDIVNAASRIETLNKQLGTHVLLSEYVARGTEGIVTRDVGRFRLMGKTHWLGIHELLCPRERLDLESERRLDRFSTALEEFREGRWHTALIAFQSLLDDTPYDGPSRYYLGLCESFMTKPPSTPWDGVVVLTQK